MAIVKKHVGSVGHVSPLKKNYSVTRSFVISKRPLIPMKESVNESEQCWSDPKDSSHWAKSNFLPLFWPGRAGYCFCFVCVYFYFIFPIMVMLYYLKCHVDNH